MSFKFRVSVLSIISAFLIGALVFVTSKEGKANIALWMVRSVIPYESISFDSLIEHHREGVTLRNVTIQGIAPWSDSKLRIQGFHLKNITPFGIEAEIENARLLISPAEDPIIFSGILVNSQLMVDAFSPKVSLEKIKPFFKKNPLKHIHGTATNVDLSVMVMNGVWMVNGTFDVQDVKTMDYSVSNSRGSFLMHLNLKKPFPNPVGKIILSEGIASDGKVSLPLKQAEVMFHNFQDNPDLDIKLEKQESGFLAGVHVFGKKENLVVEFSSVPVMTEDEIKQWLVMGTKPAKMKEMR